MVSQVAAVAHVQDQAFLHGQALDQDHDQVIQAIHVQDLDQADTDIQEAVMVEDGTIDFHEEAGDIHSHTATIQDVEDSVIDGIISGAIAGCMIHTGSQAADSAATDFTSRSLNF